MAGGCFEGSARRCAGTASLVEGGSKTVAAVAGRAMRRRLPESGAATCPGAWKRLRPLATIEDASPRALWPLTSSPPTGTVMPATRAIRGISAYDDRAQSRQEHRAELNCGLRRHKELRMDTARVVCAHDCPDMCSLLAHVENNRVVRIEGDPDQPYTAGFACAKVNRDAELVHSPERIATPLRRTGPKGAGVFAPVSWHAALDEITARWKA